MEAISTENLEEIFGKAGDIESSGKIVMDAVGSFKAYEALRDITLIFGREWIEEALKWKRKTGFIEKKVKEAKEKFKENALEWARELFEAESNEARLNDMRIVFDSLMMKELVETMRKDLEEVGSRDGAKLKNLDRFIESAIEIRLIEMDLQHLMKRYEG